MGIAQYFFETIKTFLTAPNMHGEKCPNFLLHTPSQVIAVVIVFA